MEYKDPRAAPFKVRVQVAGTAQIEVDRLDAMTEDDWVSAVSMVKGAWQSLRDDSQNETG